MTYQKSNFIIEKFPIQALKKLPTQTTNTNNMPLFVMDSVSLARLPRINAEDVSYIAVASRIAETNARLDLINSLISENTARCLQNKERVQYLARQKNNHSSYSNVVN